MPSDRRRTIAAEQPQPATPSTQAEKTERAGKGDDEPEFQTLEELFTLYQPYLGNISAYEPIYFLAGTSLDKSKFQLSAKYRIFDPQGSLARKYPWLPGLHLAYTQTAFWDLKAASKPFGDTSYKPEIFFLTSNLAGEKSTWSRIFLQTGFQHESNGRGGDASRRTNFLYIEPILVLFQKESLLGLQIAPRFWIYVANEDDNNPDLADYRGYFDLAIKAGKADQLVLGTPISAMPEKGPPCSSISPTPCTASWAAILTSICTPSMSTLWRKTCSTTESAPRPCASAFP